MQRPIIGGRLNLKDDHPYGAVAFTEALTLYAIGNGGTFMVGCFDSSRSVQVGPENSPRTFTILVWRRVA